MYCRYSSALIACLAALLSLLALGRSAHAQIVPIGYTGVITSIADPFNVFNNTLSLGSTVQGLFQYDVAHWEQLNVSPPPPPSRRAFRYANTGNDGFLNALTNGVPMTTTAFSALFAQVYNDDPEVGDLFQINNQSIDFPTAFSDGGPDYDQFFVDGAALSLRLTDSTGAAFSSLNFPLGMPNLAAFDNAEGVLIISAADINTGEYVQTEARFRLTSLAPTAAPEPGSIALYAMVGLPLLGSLIRHKKLA